MHIHTSAAMHAHRGMLMCDSRQHSHGVLLSSNCRIVSLCVVDPRPVLEVPGSAEQDKAAVMQLLFQRAASAVASTGSSTPAAAAAAPGDALDVDGMPAAQQAAVQTPAAGAAAAAAAGNGVPASSAVSRAEAFGAVLSGCTRMLQLRGRWIRDDCAAIAAKSEEVK
jgi:hypothetical protein